MEPEPAQVPAPAPLRRKGISSGRGRDRGVERGVETGYGGYVDQDPAYNFQPHQGLRLVERGKVAE